MILRKSLAWLFATLLAISTAGCFDGHRSRKDPSFTGQPASVTVTAGATATFTVTVDPAGTPLQWYRNGAPIAGATAASYTTPPTTAADDGATFRATITSGSGTVTSSTATLTVNVPAAITAQPAGTAVTTGSTATFSVTATGTRLSYQWQRGTTDIPGATASTYTTPATTLADDGATFRVVVTNALGSVTSDPATLTVTDPAPASTFRTSPMVSDYLGGGVALKADGTVWAWGTNAGYQVGNGTAAVTVSPAQTVTAGGPLTRIVKISAGRSHVLALDADGHVWAWGTSVALGTGAGATVAQVASPVLASSGGAPLANVVDVAAGDGVSIAALADGTVVAWGSNANGAMGVAQPPASVDFPTAVAGASSVVEVAAGADRLYTRTSDGRVFAWGKAGSGLGNGTNAETTTPTQVAGVTSAARIEADAGSALAILSDGTATVWGQSYANSTAGPSAAACGPTDAPTPVGVARPAGTASGFRSIATATNAHLFVYGGALYELGDQVEDGALAAGTPVCTGTLQAVTGLSNLAGVARSWGPFTHVWTADGRIYGVGENGGAELGVGNTTSGPAPVAIPGFNLLGAPVTGTTVLSLDFESALPASVDPGTAFLTGVEGYAGLGAPGNQFGGNMLRSATGNVVTVTLTNLPPHTSVNLAFLFAAIDSLDGAGSFPAGDYFRITLDGNTIFREAFSNSAPWQVQTYLPPPGVELARRVDLGFQGPGSFYTDSAYDMGADPQFQLIPHTASTLTLTFRIESDVLQPLDDESWGIDNLRISLNP